jgi:hypothetical protein
MVVVVVDKVVDLIRMPIMLNNLMAIIKEGTNRWAWIKCNSNNITNSITVKTLCNIIQDQE